MGRGQGARDTACEGLGRAGSCGKAAPHARGRFSLKAGANVVEGRTRMRRTLGRMKCEKTTGNQQEDWA